MDTQFFKTNKLIVKLIGLKNGLNVLKKQLNTDYQTNHIYEPNILPKSSTYEELLEELKIVDKEHRELMTELFSHL